MHTVEASLHYVKRPGKGTELGSNLAPEGHSPHTLYADYQSIETKIMKSFHIDER